MDCGVNSLFFVVARVNNQELKWLLKIEKQQLFKNPKYKSVNYIFRVLQV